MDPQTQSTLRSLEKVLNHMLEGLQVIDREYRYRYVNDVVASQGKKSPQELLGKTMMECYPGIEMTEMFAKIEKCMRLHQATRFENEFKFHDGTVGWFELSIQPSEEGVLILSVDITKRKQLEQQLKEKVREIELMVSTTVDRELRMTELKEKIAQLTKMIPS